MTNWISAKCGSTNCVKVARVTAVKISDSNDCIAVVDAEYFDQQLSKIKEGFDGAYFREDLLEDGLEYSDEEWDAFVDGVRAGDFDNV